MTFALDTEVARVLQAALEKNGPPPAPPADDVRTRRVTLDAMLEYFNNQAQPPADDVEIFDLEVTTADGATLLARWYRRPSGNTGAAALYLHGGGMIVGSVPIFDGPVSVPDHRLRPGGRRSTGCTVASAGSFPRRGHGSVTSPPWPTRTACRPTARRRSRVCSRPTPR